MIRILIADDHAIVRQGLRQVIAIFPDIHIAGEACNGQEVIASIRRGEIDLLLTDMTMPGLCGVDLIKRVKEESPHVSILVLSMHSDSQVASRAIKAGAAGYLTKDSEPEILIDAIRQVASGGHYITSELASRLVFSCQENTCEQPHCLLSDREYQVFLLLVQGKGVNDIAEQLSLSAKTISTHKFRLMQKMNIDSLSDLVRYAVKYELIEV